MRRRHVLVGSVLIALRKLLEPAPVEAQSCFVNECVPGPYKDLRYCNFQGAGHGSWSFYGSDCQGANFLEADLRNADFRYANLQDACFLGADIREADFAYSTGFPASMCWARIGETIYHDNVCADTTRCCPAAEYDVWRRGQ